MRSTFKGLQGAAVAALMALAACGEPASTDEAAAAPEEGGPVEEFTIGWTIYAGWMPWPYAQQSGILQKWADKYGIAIDLVQINDYVESLNQFTAGTLDGVTSTNMDALTIPAASGTDTTVLIMGDYSNGNDGIVLKDGDSVADLAGQSVNLVELSVSHYLLARALEMNGMTLPDVTTVNTSDADIVSAWATPDVTAAAPWNPQLTEILAMPGTVEVFDSSQIPNEIQDLTIVNTAVLAENPELGQALAGAWYEVMGLLAAGDADAIAAMAAIAGTTPESYAGQLATTYIYYDPADAVAYVNSPELITHTDSVRQFSFAQGLFGPTATSVDAIGIQFPNSGALGDPANVKLRFDPTYMQMAADGAL